MSFKKLALLHDFDGNIAVAATTVASITTGIVQFQAKCKITPAKVAASSWDSVCVPGACPRRQCQQQQWMWLRRQQASSNLRLTANLLK